MKIYNILTKSMFFLMLTILLAACRDNNFDDDDIFQFEVQSFVDIPAGLSAGIGLKHTFQISNVPTNIESLLSENGLSKDEIKGIYPRRAILNTEFPDETFNFLLIAELNLRNNNSRKEAFYHPEVPRNPGNELILYENNQVDMKDFLLQNKFNYELVTQHESITPRTIRTRVRLIFGVQ